MTENHHNGGLKLINRVLQRTERRILQDVAGGTHHERVAQAQVKNNFRREARVAATENRGERELTRSQVGAADGVLVGVLVATLNETSVAVLQTLPCLCGGRLNLVGLLSHGVFSLIPGRRGCGFGDPSGLNGEVPHQRPKELNSNMP